MRFQKGYIPWHKGKIFTEEEKTIRRCQRDLKIIKIEEKRLLLRERALMKHKKIFCSIHNPNLCLDIRL